MRISALSLSLALFVVSASASTATQERLLSPQNRLFSTFVAAGAKWEYTDCGPESDALKLESLTISPDPPVPGKDLTITAKGYARETIEDGAYADVTVKLGLIKLLSKRFDVCEEARNANVSISCPVPEGKYEVVHTVALPKEIPRAKFTVQVRAYTVEEEEILCLDLKADFLPRN
ncbi:ML domain-containing protein [Mycena latifolia]|nr:ML domain-containing protein [Mycena latifolia]